MMKKRTIKGNGHFIVHVVKKIQLSLLQLIWKKIFWQTFF